MKGNPKAPTDLKSVLIEREDQDCEPGLGIRNARRLA